jgi:type IV pilus assembly protein PilV
VKNRAGFTILEVLVAMMILTVGILGLVTTAALVTRMIGQGQRYSEASTLAAQRIERMRSRSCTTLANGGATQGAYTISWTVDAVSQPNSRVVTVVVVSPTNRGTRADTFATTIAC